MAMWQSVEVSPLEHWVGSLEGQSSASGIRVLHKLGIFTYELQGV